MNIFRILRIITILAPLIERLLAMIEDQNKRNEATDDVNNVATQILSIFKENKDNETPTH